MTKKIPNLREILLNFSTIYNVHVSSLHTNNDYQFFDLGIRNLFLDEANIQEMKNYFSSIQDRTIVFQTDEFFCNYLILKLPNVTDVICIGPYLKFHASHEEIESIFKSYEIHNTSLLREIGNIYRGIPVILDSDAFHRFFIEVFSFYDLKYSPANAYRFPFDTVINYGTLQKVKLRERGIELFIKERYSIEKLFLKEIRHGNTDKALWLYNDLKRVSSEYTDMNLPTSTNRIYLMSINTMLRLTASEANVHPLYIDQLSGVFTRKIINSNSKISFIFVERMIEEYCELINQYSYRGLSELVKSITQTINNNLKYSYSLAELSEQFSISPTHLSAKFKHEHGITITEYTNTKRLFLSKQLLIDSDVPISEVAAACGFDDPNYFSRIFKKSFNVSPTTYRNSKEL